MDWIKVSILTRPEAVPALEAIFFAQGVTTVEEAVGEEVRLSAYFSAPLSSEGEEALEKGIAAVKAAGIDIGRGLLEKELVREENWAHQWKKYYAPLPVGRKFLICPTWQYEERPGRLTIALDPGQAFGTGYHPTTRLCLAELEDTRPDTLCYDLGTGSGILAIALARLEHKVIAYELDPVAVAAARANGRANRVEFELREEDLLTCPPPALKGQLVVANLTADLLISFAPKLPAFLAKGGKFVGGGIQDFRKSSVQEALEKAGVVVEEVQQEGEWLLMVGRQT